MPALFETTFFLLGYFFIECVFSERIKNHDAWGMMQVSEIDTQQILPFHKSLLADSEQGYWIGLFWLNMAMSVSDQVTIL